MFQLERENICLVREGGNPRNPAKFFGFRTCAGDKRNCWQLRNDYDRNTKQRKRAEHVTVVGDHLFQGGGSEGYLSEYWVADLVLIGLPSAVKWRASVGRIRSVETVNQRKRVRENLNNGVPVSAEMKRPGYCSFCPVFFLCTVVSGKIFSYIYRGADKSLAQTGRKQATAT